MSQSYKKDLNKVEIQFKDGSNLILENITIRDFSFDENCISLISRWEKDGKKFEKHKNYPLSNISWYSVEYVEYEVGVASQLWG